MNPNDIQVGGEHYRSGYQPWDFTMDIFGNDFFLGSVNKYVVRWRRKNGVEDLKKALHYLQKFIEEVRTNRIEPPLLYTKETATALLRHYALANQIGLAETDILSAMVLGRWDHAMEYLEQLIREQSQ